MSRWLPKWLADVYSKLLLGFGMSQFTIEQARKIGIKKPAVTLPRLAKAGWIIRISRGNYVVSEPKVAVISCFQNDWRDMIKQKEYIPLLEFIVARLLEGYDKKLKGLVLFGSIARGTAKQESDVDLIVVAEDMLERYGDRVRKTLSLLSAIDVLKKELYYKMKLHPSLDLILLDVKEMQEPYPFFLDVVREGIILFDKDGYTSGILNYLKDEFQKIGAVRVEHTDGRWHWEIPTARQA